MLAVISRRRLSSQQVTNSECKTAKDIVAWMGAMQAQNYPMAKWAVGIRLPGSTGKAIESAISSGEIIRTHLLRPTWHLVSPGNIYWMLELTAPQIRVSLKSRHKDLDLTESIFQKSNAVIREALGDGNHKTREELAGYFNTHKIMTNENRASHLLLRAELDGIICSGVVKGEKQTYALLDERVPRGRQLSREEGLCRLAKLYFASHGPATIQDFSWWSGLSAGEAKQALEMVKADFLSQTIGSQTYWFTDQTTGHESIEDDIQLLPAYDEFIISYKDRRASLPDGILSKAVSNNGVFWPVIVVNGQVTGIWKSTVSKNKVRVEINFFSQPDQATRTKIETAAFRYTCFLEKETEIVIKN